MSFCTRCGKELLPTDNFCPRCGLAVNAPVQAGQPLVPGAVTEAQGLSRNVFVSLTGEGLHGVQLSSPLVLTLAFIIPIPFLAAVYYALQAGALAVYVTLWVTASGMLYDEFRWRGLNGLGGRSPQDPPAGRESWLVPWNSVRMADWNGRTLWFSSTGLSRKLSVTFDRKDAQTVEQTLRSSGVRYSWRGPRLPPFLTRFTTLAILMFVVSQAILILAATMPFFPGEQQVYTTILNNTRSQVVGASFFGVYRAIFFNNLQVAWGGAVPFLGALAFGIASYSTGRVIQVIAIDQSVSPVAVLVGLYILPHTWVEESAYPIAAVAGMLGVTRWRSVGPGEFGRRWNWGSTKLALALGGSGLILLIAGFIETLTTYIHLLAVVIWVPVGVGYYLLAKRYGRRGDEGGPT